MPERNINENAKYLLDSFKSHLEVKEKETMLVMIIDKKENDIEENNVLYCDILSTTKPKKCTLKLNGLSSDEMDELCLELANGFLELIGSERTINNLPGLGLEIMELNGETVSEGYTCFYASNFPSTLFEGLDSIGKAKKYQKVVN